MAKNDSTVRIDAGLFQATEDYIVNMQSFFDLAEREIDQHNNTDFDSIAFLVRSAKAEIFKLSELYCREREKMEVS